MGINLWQRGIVAALAILMAGAVWAARESNVRQTKHNLSSSGSYTVKATSETQVCVFCHTPHAATTGATPLWNRKLSSATYTPYSSNSLDAKTIEGALAQPGGSSKLCLSCHDGTLAIGNVNVLNGVGSNTSQGTVSIAMSGTGAGGVMAPGSGTSTGFTRFLDTDLGNDHPISVTYNPTLTARDGELRTPTLNPVEGTYEWVSGANRILGVRNYTGTQQKPVLPLEKTGSATDAGQVQCASCHDPHIRETDSSKGNQKFLRQNRFQEATPSDAYSKDNDIICLSCHDKNQGSGAWAYSAHANPLVATQTYLTTPGDQREFPANLPVWKAACLNCHDTHSIPGSRRLLRESTDSGATPKTGGSSAIEETCYQCHSASGTSIITPLTTVPDIKTDFTTLSYKMPITSANQPAGSEVHDIGGNFNDGAAGGAGAICDSSTNKCGKDFVESRSLLGVANLSNRHAECTDCHNPHRVVKFKDFRGASGGGVISGTPDASGTHPHTDTAMTHTNIASGVLRGAWGVEPIYGSASFHALPSGYTVKRGDPGSSTNSTAAASHVTREYQICLKCHSDYGYSDNNTYPAGNRPTLGSFVGGTPSGTMGLTVYTNQAKEFQAPVAHATEPANLGNDAGSADSTLSTGRFNVRNHRSWHPVMAPTGRTTGLRNVSTGAWDAPWSNAIGTQTMYCTDCHGSSTGAATAIPTGGENGSPWGPHGSSNVFLLKGAWNDVNSGASNFLCLKCHNPTSSSGFSGGGKGNLHQHHQDKVGTLRCTWCHIAVPHGWKNRSLLVNLNDVGEEAGQGVGSSKEVAISNGSGSYYSKEPYYFKAKLKILNFATSGSWSASDCGSAGKSGTGLTTGIINGSAGSSNGGSSGKDWMITNACSSAP